MHPYYVFNGPAHTIGPQGPLHCSSTTSLSLSLPLSVFIQSLASFLSLSAFIFTSTSLFQYTWHSFDTFPLLTVFFVTCWGSCGWRSGYRWRRHFLWQACLCVLDVCCHLSKFTTGSCALEFLLHIIQCVYKCVSTTGALWGWAIGTRPLFLWLGNPVFAERKTK